MNRDTLKDIFAMTITARIDGEFLDEESLADALCVTAEAYRAAGMRELSEAVKAMWNPQVYGGTPEGFEDVTLADIDAALARLLEPTTNMIDEIRRAIKNGADAS